MDAMSEFQISDPPPTPQAPGRLQRWVQFLDEHPGEWSTYGRDVYPATLTYAKNRVAKEGRSDDFEFTLRKSLDDGGTVKYQLFGRRKAVEA